MGQWIEPIDDIALGRWIINRRNRAWPTPNTKRAFGGYWFPNAGRDPAPMLTNYLLRFSYRGTGQPILWVAHQCEPVADEDFHVYSDSGVNGLGQRLQMHVRDVSVPTGPAGDTGIEWEWIYDREGFADSVHTRMFIHRDTLLPTAAVPFDHDWPQPKTLEPGRSTYNVETPLGDTDWTVGSNPALDEEGLHLVFWAYPERYALPGEAPLAQTLRAMSQKNAPSAPLKSSVGHAASTV